MCLVGHGSASFKSVQQRLTVFENKLDRNETPSLFNRISSPVHGSLSRFLLLISVEAENPNSKSMKMQMVALF